MKNCIIILLFLLTINCSPASENQYDYFNLKKHKEILTIGDSIFFSHLTDIAFNENEYFIILNDRLYVLDKDLNFLRSFGSPGRGPGEFVDPQNILVMDGKVYITDSGKNKIVQYESHTGFTGEWELGDRYYTVNAFAMDNNGDFYFSSPLEKPIHKIANTKAKEPVSKFGDFIRYDNKQEGFVNNFNHIIRHNDKIISISTTQPIMKTYTREGDLVDEYTLPNSLFENRLKFKENEIKLDIQNRLKEYVLIRDVYHAGNRIYLLINENIGNNFDFYSNKVLVIEKNDKESILKSIIKLPGEVYTTICVGDGFLVGFDTYTKSLDMVELPKKL